MSTKTPHEREPEGDDLVAAEYVLGVLSGGERQAAAARIEAEPPFARLVDQWENRLAPLGKGYREIEPPASVKAALDKRLFGAGKSAGFWSSLAFWRALSAAALGLAALLVVILVQPVPQAQTLVASLAADGSDVRYVVVYDAASRDVGLNHLSGHRADGKDFELWVIEKGKAPISAGIIAVGSQIHMTMPEDLARKVAAGAVLAISLEPGGGSPTGQPTGPVVAAGELFSA